MFLTTFAMELFLVNTSDMFLQETYVRKILMANFTLKKLRTFFSKGDMLL